GKSVEKPNGELGQQRLHRRLLVWVFRRPINGKRDCLRSPQAVATGVFVRMKKLVSMVRTGPVVVGEFRGGRGETAKRFDKTDKNAPPLEFGMYKMNLEMLADGSPVMVTVFLDKGINAEEFGAKVQIKRGEIVAVAVNKLRSEERRVGKECRD